MEIGFLLLLLAGGALLVPLFGGDDDDEAGTGGRNGTPEDDELEGTAGPDLIQGFLGDDTINGNGGLDILRGGGGEDTITGGEDRDEIFGGADNDDLFGLGGNDTIEGGGGDDYIDAGEGNDIVRAGAGNDTVFGNNGTDTLRGEDDDDDIFLWGEEGRAFGGDGDDELIMVTGRGVLEGVAGDNTFYAFANDDDAQQTLAVIDDFGIGDEIVMTIDTSDAGAEDADILVTLTEGTLNGIAGYNIEVSFADPEAVAGSETVETSRVFINGTASVTPQQVLDALRVDVTVDAELSVEGAAETFASVAAGATNSFAVNSPLLTV